MIWRSFAGAAATTAALAMPLACQAPSLLFGAVHARYADSVSGSALIVAPRVLWNTASTTSRFEAALTQFSEGAWALQADASTLGIWSVAPHLAAGGLVGGYLSYLEGGFFGGLASLGPIGAYLRGPLAATLGVSLGTLRRVDDTSDGLVAGALRARYELSTLVLGGELGVTGSDTLGFTDLNLSASFPLRGATVETVIGTRAGDLSDRFWWQARGEYTPGAWGTIEGTIGSFPKDLTGFTEGIFFSVGLRLGRPGPGLARRTLERTLRAPLRPVVERLDGDHVRVTFQVSGATSVAVAGEWNEWTPIPMTPMGSGRWSIDLPLGQGAYRFALVLDGDRWMVPEGVLTLPDDFGGTVGLLIVSE